MLVGRKRQEFLELVGSGDLLEQLARFRKMPAIEPRGADLAAQAIVLFTNAMLHGRFRDGPAVVERRAMSDPLPDLRARDLGGGRVFHEVVDRDRALTAEPRLEILDADA